MPALPALPYTAVADEQPGTTQSPLYRVQGKYHESDMPQVGAVGFTRGRFIGLFFLEPPMSFLKVVKAGDPEPDSEILEMKRSAAERLLASGDCPFFLYLEEADEAIVTYGGDMLEISATVEEVARGAKRRALGWAE